MGPIEVLERPLAPPPAATLTFTPITLVLSTEPSQVVVLMIEWLLPASLTVRRALNSTLLSGELAYKLLPLLGLVM